MTAPKKLKKPKLTSHKTWSNLSLSLNNSSDTEGNQPYTPDILSIVLLLRKQRNRGMVQTEAQYLFIHDVIQDELRENCCAEPSISNHSTSLCGPYSPTRIRKHHNHPIVIHDSQLDYDLSRSSTTIIDDEDSGCDYSDSDSDSSVSGSKSNGKVSSMNDDFPTTELFVNDNNRDLKEDIVEFDLNLYCASDMYPNIPSHSSTVNTPPVK